MNEDIFQPLAGRCYDQFKWSHNSTKQLPICTHVYFSATVCQGASVTKNWNIFNNTNNWKYRCYPISQNFCCVGYQGECHTKEQVKNSQLWPSLACFGRSL